MKRLVHVIESEQGYLTDIESYTQSIEDAVTFTDLETACHKLAAISGMLASDCWIGVAYMEFPRVKPVIPEVMK